VQKAFINSAGVNVSSGMWTKGLAPIDGAGTYDIGTPGWKYRNANFSGAVTCGNLTAYGYVASGAAGFTNTTYPDSSGCISWNAGAGDASTYIINSFSSAAFARGFYFAENYYGSSITRTARIDASGAYAPTSDDRLKDNEVLIENAVDTLMKLRPQVYDKYVSFERNNENLPEPIKESGLIAQEIYYDAPELRHLLRLPMGVTPAENIQSTTDPNQDPDYSSWGTEPSMFCYTQLIPYLIKAVQELKNENDVLKNSVNELNNKNDIINNTLNSVLERLNVLENI
jgi:hypothetical protein